MRLVLTLLPVLIATSTARADQCALVDSKVATKAIELVRRSTKVLDFCEPCGDKVARGPYRIVSTEIRGRQVVINSKPVDLAYVYIHTGGDDYSNLAKEAGCIAHGVSPTVKDSRSAQTPLPPPPMPSGPPMPPGGPPTIKRVSSPDDIGGTWNVSLRPSVSTCGPVAVSSPMPSVPPVTWTITSTSGDISIMTDDGHELTATGATLSRFTMLDVQVDAKRGKLAMRLHQFLKDSFDGKLIAIETQGRGKTCATYYDVWGRRAP